MADNYGKIRMCGDYPVAMDLVNWSLPQNCDLGPGISITQRAIVFVAVFCCDFILFNLLEFEHFILFNLLEFEQTITMFASYESQTTETDIDPLETG
jgi:hypothetical protein